MLVLDRTDCLVGRCPVARRLAVGCSVLALIRKGPSMLHGRITRLRRIEREDTPTLVRWFGDPAVREFLLLNRPISMAEEEQ